ncbi:MAG: hypothetical protein DCC72_07030 [Burkholderiales bacterium]|jgi:cytoskeleton protein RodZ|nr:MAG: hypothetical protein DCC72_07030 [Burkholderiales bacterium]
MNVEATTSPESITQIASLEQLCAAREARGWSISDVAAKLGMMPRQIDAIEHGRWEALPGTAFVRGAIRAYGKALQLDVAPLLATLGSPNGAPELKPSSSLDSPLPRHGALGFDNGGSGSRIVWIILGVIGVVAIAMYFGRGADFGQVLEPGSGGSGPGRAVDVVPLAPGTSPGAGAGDSTRTPSDSTGAAPADAARSPAPDSARPPSAPSDASAASGAAGSGTTPAAGAAATAPASSAGTQSAPATAPSGSAGGGASPAAAAGDASTSAAADGASAATAAQASAPAAKNAATPAAADAVVLRFERESWVDVRDANGKVLLMGTQPPNSTREVSGQKPYSLTIGNATFVRVEHGGRNVDLGAVTQKGVARVRIE